LLLLSAWDSLANPELKETMGQAEVIGAPEVYFLERYDRGKM
jgi:hypothetical protein